MQGRLCSRFVVVFATIVVPLGAKAPAAGEPLMFTRMPVEVAPPGTRLPLAVFLQDVTDLRGYQATIAITRLSGSGTLSVECPGGALINESRSDYVFAGAGTSFSVTNCEQRRASSTLLSGGVDVGAAAAYLAEYELRLSSDAAAGSTFEVAVLPFSDSALSDPSGNPIAFAVGSPQVVTVAPAIPASSAWGQLAMSLALITGAVAVIVMRSSNKGARAALG